MKEGGLRESDIDGDDGYESDSCPKCGAKKLFHGYGLMGGGIGAYEGCDAEGCDYWSKDQDPDEPSDVVCPRAVPPIPEGK